MKTFVGALAVVALVASAAASATGASTAVWKCKPGTPIIFPHAPETVYVVDGKAVSERAAKKIAASDIESMSVACADQLYEVFGVEARLGGVIIFTSPGPYSALQAAVESIVALQEAHLSEHGSFAAGLGDLQWSDPSGLITLTLTVSEDGSRWTATGTHRYLIGSREPEITVSGERTPSPVAGG